MRLARGKTAPERHRGGDFDSELWSAQHCVVVGGVSPDRKVRLPRQKTRRLSSASEIARRAERRISIGDWLDETRATRDGLGIGEMGENGRHSPSASSAPRLGVGGGVGGGSDNKPIEKVVSGLDYTEGVEEKKDDATQPPVDDAQTGMRHQPIRARDRRTVPETTSIQDMFLPVINSDAFYYVIMGAIFVNCIQLAATSPLDPSPDPQAMQDFNMVLDYVLFFIFSIEFVLKHLALYPTGYWSDHWNKLDGTIVIVGYLAYIPGVGDYPAIRVLRIIRPMRVIGKLDGMKKILVTISAAIQGLFNTLLLCGLIFLMFGIVGCTLFGGVTRQRCFSETVVGNITTWSVDESNERACGGHYTCPGSQTCQYHISAPSYSIISFDTIYVGFLTLFVAITLEGWVDVMYLIQDGYGYTASTAFFCFLIIFGSLFTLNLALAVISDAYENQEKDWEAAEREATNQLRSVHLMDEVIDLEKLCLACRAAQEEIDGLDNYKSVMGPEEAVQARIDALQARHDAEEFDITKAELSTQIAREQETFQELTEIEDSIVALTEEVLNIAKQIKEMADILQDEPGCEGEAALVRVVGEEMEKNVEPEVEVVELSAEEQEEEWVKERLNMHPFQAFFHSIAVAGWFDKLIMFFIIFNTVCLAQDHVKTENGHAVPMDQSAQDVLAALNYLFIAVFTIEVIVKLCGLGPIGYIKDTFNMFDFFIVIMSFVELGFADNSSLSALRTFRLARVFKLAKNWKSLRDLLRTILETIPEMSYLSVLLILFMFMMSVAGMMFFGGKFNHDMDGGRHRFDNFGIAMLTVFQMLTGENWNSVLYDGMEYGSEPQFVFSVPYFLTVQILGNFVVLNLFLAILLSKFGDDDGDEGSEYPSLEDVKAGCMSFFALPSNKVEPEPSDVSSPTPEPDRVSEQKSDTGAGVDSSVTQSGQGSSNGTQPIVEEDDKMLARSMAAINKQMKEEREEEEMKPVPVLTIEDMDVKGTSVFCFKHDNVFRRQLALIVGWTERGKESLSTPFANFIFFLIIISSITLAIDQPVLDKESTTKEILNVADVLFTIIFTMEMFMKIIVYGFLFTEDAYLKDGWNLLDFFIVITSILALPANAVFGGSDDSAFSSLRILRTFRALRPLRMINRAPGLKVVVDAIFKCLPAFLNISLVTSLVYLVFAIMGVQLWAGKFWSCNDETVANFKECTGTYVNGDGDTVAREWSNKPLNFDNVQNALLTLFEVASLEIWLDVMYAAMDVPAELDEQPQTNQSWGWALYFVVFVVVGSFLFLNLFVGAVVDNFNRIKSELDKKGAIMTDEQEAFVQSMKTMFNKKPSPKPQPPDKNAGAFGAFRYKIFKFIQYDLLQAREAEERRKAGLPSIKKEANPLFDHVITILIATNIIVMALPVWNQPPFGTEVGSADVLRAQDTSWNKGLETINAVYNFLFVIECVLKLLGLGVQQYFKSGMNIFDFCIVTVSVTGFIIDKIMEDVDPSLLSIISVIKAARVVRIFRLAMRLKGLRKLLETLIYTLPSLFNVTCLLIIVLFIYTVLGMAFFGEQDFNKPPFYLYNDHANFRTFWVGFLTLFRMSTGESWNGIMHDSMDNVSKYAWIYYFTYMILGSYLLFQLIVAVVLEQFSSAAAEEEAVVTPDDIEMYTVTWREMDPTATGKIDIGQLPILIKALDPPLGCGHEATTSEIMEFLRATELLTHGGRADILETFFTLVHHAYASKFKRRWKGRLNKDIIKEMHEQLTQRYPASAELDVDEECSSAQHFAAQKNSIYHSQTTGPPENCEEETGEDAEVECINSDERCKQHCSSCRRIQLIACPPRFCT